MSQVIKSFMGVFFLLSMLLLGIGILSAQTEVADALDYKADIIAELENSNYNAKVMEACIRQAKKADMKWRSRHIHPKSRQQSIQRTMYQTQQMWLWQK